MSTIIIDTRLGIAFCKKCGKGFCLFKPAKRAISGQMTNMANVYRHLASHIRREGMRNKREFYGPCLPQRKQHYFGRNTGWAGGMGTPWQYKCVWCGKYNPKWEPKFWEEEERNEKENHKHSR